MRHFFTILIKTYAVDGGPDLCLHRTLGSAEKRLDAQMLFDPLEEQLDLLAAAIQLRDG